MKQTTQQAGARVARKTLPLHALALLALTLLPAAASAQWTAPDASGRTNYPNGNVGIGTQSPDKKLVIVDGVDLYLKFLRSNNTGLYLYSNGDFNGLNAYDFNSGAVGVYKPLTLGWGGANVYLARTGGNVGVGTDAPADRLHVHNPSALGAIRVSGSGAGVVNFVDSAAAANARTYQWKSQGGRFSLGLVNDSGGGYARENILTANAAGNVGVGTASPQYALHVQRDVDGDASLYLLNGGGGQHSRSILLLGEAGTGANYGYLSYQGANNTSRPNSTVFANSGAGGFHILSYGGAGNTGGLITFNTAPAGEQGNNALAERMRIDRDGNVGIGTGAPAARLHVAGDVVVDGNINAKFQDVAEWVPATQKLSAGTVVVLDRARTNHVLASSKAYDTRVAGVVSESPGVILGVGGEGKLKVATTGRVKVRVDATRAPVEVGDLLVTSEAEGVAMKSVPVELGGVQIHRPGTIIGKALEPLEKGVSEILVLLSLQ